MNNAKICNLSTLTIAIIFGTASLAFPLKISAQDFFINPNGLKHCPPPDYSKSTDVERHSHWNACWGTYSFDINEKTKGLVIEAEFLNGKPNGTGKFFWKRTGELYVGMLKDGRKDGEGMYISSNGDKYIGGWKDDKRDGFGEYYYLARNQYRGDRFFGEYKNNSMNGKGIYKKRDGRVLEGIWQNDKFVREEKVISTGMALKNEDDRTKYAQSILDGIRANEINTERLEILNQRKNLKDEERRIAELSIDLVTRSIEKKYGREISQTNRLNLKVSNSQPNSEGEFEINIQTNTDTASLTVNGEEAGGREDGSYTVKKVARVGQETKFTIVAKDTNGNTDSKTISVIRKVTESTKVKYSELNPAILTPLAKKDAVAIIIGIENYKSFPKADFSNNDARVFYDYALRQLGVRSENIKLLVDGDADEIDIMKAFTIWLPSRVTRNTDIYVYYSGHGLPTADGQGLYLLPQRADRDFIEKTAINQQEINAALQRAKPKSVTIFLDSCYSGLARTGEALLASARPITLKASTPKFPIEFTVITASKADQISSSSPDLKHGIFSYYLMRGMEGEADTNKDGKITFGEMHSYLSENVAKHSSLLNRVQQPNFIGDENKVLVER